MLIDLEMIKKEQYSYETVKNEINKDLKEINHSLELAQNSIQSEQLDNKLQEVKDIYEKVSADMTKSLDNVSIFIKNQLEKYNNINEATKVNLDDLIEMLDAIENPLKEYLKEDEINEWYIWNEWKWCWN